MKHCYFDIKEFRPEVGSEFDFHAGDGTTDFHHLCRVVELIPHKKLAYTWRYEGLETFPKLPQFAKKNFKAGWTMIIGTKLKEFAER